MDSPEQVTSEALLEQAMRLSSEERTALAMALLDSVDGAPDGSEPLSDEDFREELSRRVEHSIRHPDDGVEWDHLRAELVSKTS